jgi:hypothetical protein
MPFGFCMLDCLDPDRGREENTNNEETSIFLQRGQDLIEELRSNLNKDNNNNNIDQNIESLSIPRNINLTNRLDIRRERLPSVSSSSIKGSPGHQRQPTNNLSQQTLSILRSSILTQNQQPQITTR